MTTASAITKLRKKLGYTQQQFADALRVTVVTVSRYENGREPAAKILQRLVELAKRSQAQHLQELFAAKLQSDVASRVESLPSTGAERRVPKFYFDIWIHRQEEIFRGCTGLLKRSDLTLSEREKVVQGIRRYAERTWKELRTFLTESVPDLDPNEDFYESLPSLYSTLAPDEIDWMGILLGPRRRPTRGVLGRQILASRRDDQPKQS